MPLLEDLRVHVTHSQMLHLIQILQSPEFSPSSTYPLPLLQHLAISFCFEYESPEGVPDNWTTKIQEGLKKLLLERGNKGTATLRLVRVLNLGLDNELIEKLAKLVSGIEITNTPDPNALVRPH